jgi:pimeloyl-ACP methyl ester carboxylesterase
METLLLLHGAIGAADQLQPLAAALSPHFSVHTFSFSGHGGEPMTAADFSIPLFAADVLAYMQQHRLAQVSILGYSMGGYVAMYLAKHHPDKINKVLTLATKYLWTEEIAAREIQMLQPEKITQKLPAFAATLSARHAPNSWAAVLQKTADMMVALGASPTLSLHDYTTITTPSLLLLGDRDKMVSIEETIAVYKALPDAQFGILPGTAHPIEQADVSLLCFYACRFFLP